MSGVDVRISDAGIISALNTPGGGVFKWRDAAAERVVTAARAKAPINNPLNATHRGGVVGTYKASFHWDRIGSNQHRVRARISNTADHADIVELGRSASGGRESFGWVEHNPPGAIATHQFGTSGREGQHILRDALQLAV